MVGTGEWSDLYTFLIVEKPTAPLDLRYITFDDTLVTLEWT
jgi:hypothetical protein